MQLANITVAIAGDTGNTVQKFGVTASEIAVLRVIHGSDAVFDIEVLDDEPRSVRAEKERLAAIYGQTKDANNNVILTQLFPGAAARLFETVAELELEEGLFKATSRGSAAVKAVVEDPIEEPVEEIKPPAKPLTAKEKKAAAQVAAKQAAAEAAAKQAEIDAAVEEDGIDEMPDAKTDVLD